MLRNRGTRVPSVAFKRNTHTHTHSNMCLFIENVEKQERRKKKSHVSALHPGTCYPSQAPGEIDSFCLCQFKLLAL